MFFEPKFALNKKEISSPSSPPYFFFVRFFLWVTHQRNHGKLEMVVVEIVGVVCVDGGG